MPGETTSPPYPDSVESEIYNHLLSDSSTVLDDLHADLLFSLQRAGWAERVQCLSLELLRAGRCTHFDDMVDVVVALAAGQTHPLVPEANANANNDKNNPASNSVATNGHEKHNISDAANGISNALNSSSSEAFFRDIDVRIPKEVVEQGVRTLKDSLRLFATIEDDHDGPDADEKELVVNGKTSKSSDKKPNKLVSNGNGNVSPTKNSQSVGKEKKSKLAKDGQ